MPVLAGRPVTVTVRPATLTPGRPAAAVSPAGRLPRAGVSVSCPRPDGVTTPMRPGGAPSARPRATVAGRVNDTPLVAVRLSTRRRRPVPAVVRYWRAPKRVAHPGPRRVARTTRVAPRAGRSVAASTWRPGFRLAGASARRYGEPAAARTARPSSVYRTERSPAGRAALTVTTTGLDTRTVASART